MLKQDATESASAEPEPAVSSGSAPVDSARPRRGVNGRSFRDDRAIRACLGERVGWFGDCLACIVRGDWPGANYHHRRALGWRDGRAWTMARRLTRQVGGIKNGV
jgi:hypothetical protein